MLDVGRSLLNLCYYNPVITLYISWSCCVLFALFFYVVLTIVIFCWNARYIYPYYSGQSHGHFVSLKITHCQLTSLRPSDAYIIITDSDDGLSLGRRQAIICTNAGIFLIGRLKQEFRSMKCIWKRRLRNGGNWCLGLNVLRNLEWYKQNCLLPTYQHNANVVHNSWGVLHIWCIRFVIKGCLQVLMVLVKL